MVNLTAVYQNWFLAVTVKHIPHAGAGWLSILEYLK